MTQRILRNTSGLLKRTFTVDGDATDADGNVTVTIFDEAGTLLQAATNATSVGSGVYSYLLAPQTQLNRLTATWVGTWSGVEQTVTDYIEIVGAHLFTETEARNTNGGIFASASVYPDKDIAEARDRIADEFQQICCVSFVPRYEYETIPGTGGTDLWVRWPRISSLIAATAGSTTITATPDPRLPKLYATSGTWTTASNSDPLNVTVEYEHGWPAPPPDIKRAALILLRHQLLPDVSGSALTDRAISLTDEVGTMRLAQPGFRNAPYGIPIVDQTLARYDMNIPVN